MLVYKLTSFWVYRRRSFPIPTSLFPLLCQWWSMDANDKSALCHLNNCPSFFMDPKQRPPQEKKNIEKKESEFCFTSPQHKGFCSYRSHLERARIRVLANYIPQWQMGLSLSLSVFLINRNTVFEFQSELSCRSFRKLQTYSPNIRWAVHYSWCHVVGRDE